MRLLAGRGKKSHGLRDTEQLGHRDSEAPRIVRISLCLSVTNFFVPRSPCGLSPGLLGDNDSPVGAESTPLPPPRSSVSRLRVPTGKDHELPNRGPHSTGRPIQKRPRACCPARRSGYSGMARRGHDTFDSEDNRSTSTQHRDKDGPASRSDDVALALRRCRFWPRR